MTIDAFSTPALDELAVNELGCKGTRIRRTCSLPTMTSLASFADNQSERNAFLSDAIEGLRADQKTLPCKYFYDDQGSALFRDICELPEYYVTRTEIQLLRDAADEIAEAIGANCQMIEFGIGSSEKIRIVLDALITPASFVAVDISRESVLSVTEALAAEYAGLAVHAVCADFTQPFETPPMTGSGRRIGFFPGSTIGNFTHQGAIDFLAGAASQVGPGGGMLIGIDLKKDQAVLNAAYDDAAGVTANFNLNLLVRLNKECGADFDLNAFRHRAVYNAEAGRVEMHLVSQRRQRVILGGEIIQFELDEFIHTENSYKYSINEFQDLARRAGFEASRVWTDRDEWFSIHLLTAPAANAT